MIVLACSRDSESRYPCIMEGSQGTDPVQQRGLAGPPLSQPLAFSVCICLELAALGTGPRTLCVLRACPVLMSTDVFIHLVAPEHAPATDVH